MKKDSFVGWNWESIRELVEGPLYHPQVFESANAQKLIARLLQFLLPTSNAFASVPFTEENRRRYGQTAEQLLRVLLTFPLGQQTLLQHKLMPQIHSLLLKEMKGGSASSDSALSRERLLRTMSVEYLSLIGTMSGIPAGRQILAKTDIFSVLLPISVLEGRDDLCKIVIQKLEYK